MKKVIIVASLLCSLTTQCMLTKCPFKKTKYISSQTFIEQAQFNNRDINTQVFAEIITLKKRVQNLEQQNNILQEEIKKAFIVHHKQTPVTTPTIAEELILFRSDDQRRNNGE